MPVIGMDNVAPAASICVLPTPLNIALGCFCRIDFIRDFA